MLWVNLWIELIRINQCTGVDLWEGSNESDSWSQRADICQMPEGLWPSLKRPVISIICCGGWRLAFISLSHFWSAKWIRTFHLLLGFLHSPKLCLVAPNFPPCSTRPTKDLLSFNRMQQTVDGAPECHTSPGVGRTNTLRMRPLHGTWRTMLRNRVRCWENPQLPQLFSFNT